VGSQDRSRDLWNKKKPGSDRFRVECIKRRFQDLHELEGRGPRRSFRQPRNLVEQQQKPMSELVTMFIMFMYIGYSGRTVKSKNIIFIILVIF